MIELVKKDELITIKSFGGEFYAHRPSLDDSALVSNIMKEAREKKAEAEKKAAETGEAIQVDPLYYEKNMLKAYLKGWKNVGEEGKEIAFAPELINSLPYEVAWDVCVQLGIIRLVSEQKNSLSSASSKPTSKKGSTGRAIPARSAQRSKSKTA